MCSIFQLLAAMFQVDNHQNKADTPQYVISPILYVALNYSTTLGAHKIFTQYPRVSLKTFKDTFWM